jgi:hypothetical protein
LLMERGSDFRKEDLDVGKKKDQDLYEMLQLEYTNNSVKEYGESAFPSIWTSAALGLTENFQKISSSSDVDLPDDAEYDSMKNQFVAMRRETKRAKRTKRANNSDKMSRAMQDYSDAMRSGVETRKEELAVQQQQLVATKKLNASTEKLNAIRARKESEDLLRQLEQRLDEKIPDTPTRVTRTREHKARLASRGGNTDEDSVEAYAALMDRIQ